MCVLSERSSNNRKQKRVKTGPRCVPHQYTLVDRIGRNMQSSSADMEARLVGDLHCHQSDKNGPRRKMVSGANGSSSQRWLAVIICFSALISFVAATEESTATADIETTNFHNQTIDSDSNRLSVEISNLTISTSSEHPITTTASTARSRKPLFSTGNRLWDALIAECIKKPTFACIQKNVYSFLGESLEVGDFNVSNRVIFTKNRVDFTKYTREANEGDEEDNEIPDARGGNYDNVL